MNQVIIIWEVIKDIWNIKKELDVEGNSITSEDVGAIPTTSTNLKHIQVCFEGVS